MGANDVSNAFDASWGNEIVSSTSWILTATYMKLPVSPSESLLGAIVGFAVVRRGIMSVHWNLVGKIGVVGRCAGLWSFGDHVHLTVREKLYSVNTVVAVAIELGSGMITLYASKIGLPVSNTHNTLGSAVGVGMLIHKLKIKWKIVRNISIFMFITMPCTGLISSGVMMLLYFIADNYHHFLS
ncbi:hypothetical protein WR25_23581 [Diploscapter pachys]|uniref:Phosphate transporter n=1 Tax=Diploscapter pachys TaxID=2018661 RepID=A0A2A2L2C0_9BILA|nr:hypothetical protein WR25_23581 [Diploscapter pachys]